MSSNLSPNAPHFLPAQHGQHNMETHQNTGFFMDDAGFRSHTATGARPAQGSSALGMGRAEQQVVVRVRRPSTTGISSAAPPAPTGRHATAAGSSASASATMLMTSYHPASSTRDGGLSMASPGGAMVLAEPLDDSGTGVTTLQKQLAARRYMEDLSKQQKHNLEARIALIESEKDQLAAKNAELGASCDKLTSACEKAQSLAEMYRLQMEVLQQRVEMLLSASNQAAAELARVEACRLADCAQFTTAMQELVAEHERVHAYFASKTLIGQEPRQIWRAEHFAPFVVRGTDA